MVTPRYFTGAPTSSPCTDSRKYDSNSVPWRIRLPPRNHTSPPAGRRPPGSAARPAGTRRAPPSRRPRRQRLTPEERPHGRMRALLAQAASGRPRRSCRRHPDTPPRSSMMQRSAIARMEASSCVTTTKVAPRSSRRSRISRSSPAEVIGSSPADGSSRNSSGGSSAIARAMPARLAMPPEISAGISPAASASPTRPSLTRATASRPSGGRSVNISSGSMTFSSSVMEPNSAPDWNITPMSRRIAQRRQPAPGR